MSENNSRKKWDWEPLVEARDWDGVENWWWDWHIANPDEPEPLRTLLAELRNIVPKIRVQNGMERMERHIEIEDDPGLWKGRQDLKGAALIL